MSNQNSFTDYARAQLRDHFLRTGTFSKPATIAVALSSSASLTNSVTGNSFNEIANANGYARQTLSNTSANWSSDVSNSGIAWNLSTITFPACVTADQGWISGAVICDSATYNGGNALFWGQLTTPKYIGVGDQFTIPVSGIEVIIN